MSQQINLFNPAYARPRQTLSALSMLQVFGVLVAVALLVAALVSYLFSGLEKQAHDAAAEHESVTAKLLQLRKDDVTRTGKRLLEDSLHTTTRDIRSMQQIIDALRNDPIGDTAGYSSYLQAFARHGVDGVWLTGFSIAGAGHDMALQGRALKPELVPAYLTNLKQAAILKGVTFSALDIAVRNSTSNGTNIVEFDLRSAGMAKDSAPSSSSGPVPVQPSRPTGAKP
jgi:Tfp pilus assembly protein PilN